MTAPEIIRTARKEHICERSAHIAMLERHGVDWRSNPMYGKPCARGDEPIRVGEKYVESEGDDAYHPSRYHMECWGGRA